MFRVSGGGLPALSAGAQDIEQLQTFVAVGGGIFVVLVLALVALFLLRNRVPAGASPSEVALPDEPRPLAAASATVALLVAAVFGAGLVAYLKSSVPPEGALAIAARQSDSSWAFTYPNGDVQNDKVIVPLGRPVTFDVTTEDEPATFLVPELRLRTHVGARDLATVFLQPTATGTAHVIGPKGAVAEIQVVTAEEFDEYMRVGPTNPYCPTPESCTAELSAKWGEDLYASNACIGCHSRDGSRLVGPSFKGVYGRDETMTTGLVIKIDESYIRESIRQPQAKIVKGYENGNMPSFAALTDRKLDALVAYLKTVK